MKKSAFLIFAILASAGSQSLLLAESFSIGDDGVSVNLDQEENGMTVSLDGETILVLDSIHFDYIAPLDTKTVTSADPNSLQLQLEFPSAVDFAHHADDVQPRYAELHIEAVQGGIRLHAAPEWAQHVTLLLKDTGDHQFGLCEPLQPDNQLSPDLRGSVIDLEVKSDGQAFVENYASAFSALYMSSAGYGAFYDTFARGRYQFATTNEQHSIHHDTGTLDWYIFFGKNGTDILRSYYALIGAPKAVPSWAMGPVLWRDENSGGAAEILEDAQKFDDLRIPATAWFVDRPYSDGAHKWSHMNFGKGFENPGQWIRELREKHNVEFMTWTATAFFGDARFNHHLDDWHTYLDLSDPQNISAFQQELKNQQYVYGVKGHKMDRADENFPSYAPWFDASVGEPERRNKYVYLFAKTHHDALENAWGTDQFNFARAAIHRVQPYLSAVWGGDPRSSWDGFQGNFANAMRAGFIGFPIWGSDVGGYLGPGNIPEDLYIRWLQAGSMSGLFEIKLDGSGGMGNDRVPWHYPESLQNVFRTVCEQRMDLIPTLYSLANTSATHGVLMQPMAYADLKNPITYDIWDQFLIGDTILVAPVFTKSNHRKIYLPEGTWHEMDHPKKLHKGGRWIEMEVPLEVLPRFVKSNRIYVTGNTIKGSNQSWEPEGSALVIHVFPGSEKSEFSFSYIDPSQPGVVKEIQLKHKTGASQLTIPALNHPILVRWNSVDAPGGASVANSPIEWQQDEKGYFVKLPTDSIGETVVFVVE